MRSEAGVGLIASSSPCALWSSRISCTSLHSSPCNLTASTQDTQSEQAPSESLNPVGSTRFTAAPSNFRDRLTSRYVVLLRVGSLQAAKSDGSQDAALMQLRWSGCRRDRGRGASWGRDGRGTELSFRGRLGIKKLRSIRHVKFSNICTKH